MDAVLEVDIGLTAVLSATHDWNAALVAELPEPENAEHGTHDRYTNRKEYCEMVAVLKTSLCRRETGADPRQCVVEIDHYCSKEEENEDDLRHYAEDVDVEAQIRLVEHYQDGVHECRH